MIENVRIWGDASELGEREEYTVGQKLPSAGTITDIIQSDQAPEPYCCVSYIQVWCGVNLYAEFPKQNVAAIYYTQGEK